MSKAYLVCLAFTVGVTAGPACNADGGSCSKDKDCCNRNCVSNICGGGGSPPEPPAPEPPAPEPPAPEPPAPEPPTAVSSASVWSLNLGCRGVAPFEGCDNCPSRFGQIAEAISGTAPEKYTGLPDMDTIDFVVAQELGSLAPADYAVITDALAAKGLTYVSGPPMPETNSAECPNPPLIDDASLPTWATDNSMTSGGLVTWSRYPVLSTHAQNWCRHGLPVPAGYLATIHDVDGRAVVMVNLHMHAQYDFIGQAPETTRGYQFSEVAGFASEIAERLASAGADYTVLLGGDFNEDMYSLNLGSSTPNCNLVVDPLVIAKFNQVGLDVAGACSANQVKELTWNPDNNDLAAGFTNDPLYENLDYLTQIATSAASHPGPATHVVDVLASTTAWQGTFCSDSTQGTLGGTVSGSKTALSDHNGVHASFSLPGPSQGAAAVSVAVSEFNNAVSTWTNGASQNYICGQVDVGCGVGTAGCCNSVYSWTGADLQCNPSTFKCQSCAAEGQFCTSGVTDCCSGFHCELLSDGPQCIPLFSSGETCAFDDECLSGSCSFSCKNWKPSSCNWRCA